MEARQNMYAEATDKVVATALRTMSVSFEDGAQPVSPSEQSADLLTEAAERLDQRRR